MKAVRLYAPYDLRVDSIEEPPPPPPGSLNLKVRAAGICGSDLHNYRTGQWISRSPSTAGHEFCGEVVAVGAGVTDFGVGDFVVADSRYTCGECPACLSGRSNVCEKLGFVGEACDGGFADMAQLPARLLTRCDKSIDPRCAAMAEPLAVALHAVRRLAAPSDETVLVMGCGTIGSLCAFVLAQHHDGEILVADNNAHRVAIIQEITGARGAEFDRPSLTNALDGKRLRYAIDATGNIEAMRTGLNLLSGGGAFALVGIGHGKLDLDPNTLVEREISLVGCHAFSTELPDAVSLLPKLERWMDLICARIPNLDHFPEVYESLINMPPTKLKSIVEL